MRVCSWCMTVVGWRTWEDQDEIEREEFYRLTNAKPVDEKLGIGHLVRWNAALSIPPNALPTTKHEKEEVRYDLEMSVELPFGLSMKLRAPVPLTVVAAV